MRKISYDNFSREKKDRFFGVPALLGRKRLARRKERDPRERESLMLMDYDRYKAWLKAGILVEPAPRKYVLK